MNDEIRAQLKYLHLPMLLANWDSVVSVATKKQITYGQFLKEVLLSECTNKKNRAQLQRQKKAKIPDYYQMQTYPFHLQPKLNKKQVLEIYDSKNYLVKQENIAMIGPTGTGKTGLATAYLINAIENGYDGRFILFSDLVAELYQSIADSSTAKVLKKFSSYGILLIDELGYTELDNQAQAGLLFKLLRGRKNSTIITSNLGFADWQNFLKNENLTAALLNKFTSNCHLINMITCKSITPNRIKQV